jgi:hypothetical protein
MKNAVFWDVVPCRSCVKRRFGGTYPSSGLKNPRAMNQLEQWLQPPALESTHPPIQWVPGALSSGVKRQEREVDRSPPASAEVKRICIYTSTPPYPFMA